MSNNREVFIVSLENCLALTLKSGNLARSKGDLKERRSRQIERIFEINRHFRINAAKLAIAQ